MNEQYLNQTIRRIVYLESLKQSEINNLSAHLKEIDDLVKSLMLDEEMTDLTLAEFNKVLTSVKTGVATSLTSYTVAVGASLTAIAIDTYQFETKSLNNAFEDVKLSTKIDDKKQAKIARIVNNTPLSVTGSEGKTVTDLFGELANNESNKYINHIKLARYEGKTNQQIVQMIRGTRKNGYKDGLMEVTSRQAKTIVRTTVQHAAMQGKAEFASDNADIIKGEQWLSTLDGRTSSQCRTLDQQVFEIGKGPRPPLHHNCRSTVLIVLKDEYAGRGNINKRASKDGPVANESYYSWLNKQPKEFQDDVLGETRGKLLRSGGLSADKFAALQLDKNFKPLTLAEMKQKEPLAFKKAGL